MYETRIRYTAKAVFDTQERVEAAIAVAIEELPLRYGTYVPNFGFSNCLLSMSLLC
jgi:hypothetical protein